MLVLKSSVIQILLDEKINAETVSKVRGLFETTPIHPDKALEIIQSFLFKKELGIDCIGFLNSVLIHDQLLYIDNILFGHASNFYIAAIKKRRELFGEGLADAKNAVDARMKELGITRD